MIKTKKFPIQNSNIVFREEADNWAMLFDPDTGEAFGLNPTSSFIWKNLNGKTSIGEIVNKLEKACRGSIPDGASQEIADFIKDLVSKKLAI